MQKSFFPQTCLTPKAESRTKATRQEPAYLSTMKSTTWSLWPAEDSLLHEDDE